MSQAERVRALVARDRATAAFVAGGYGTNADFRVRPDTTPEH